MAVEIRTGSIIALVVVAAGVTALWRNPQWRDPEWLLRRADSTATPVPVAERPRAVTSEEPRRQRPAAVPTRLASPPPAPGAAEPPAPAATEQQPGPAVAAVPEAPPPISRPARVMKGGPPVYPEYARQLPIEGSVHVEITVGADGAVKNVVVKSGDPVLAVEAVAYVHSRVYEPALEQGIPVVSVLKEEIVFKR